MRNPIKKLSTQESPLTAVTLLMLAASCGPSEVAETASETNRSPASSAIPTQELGSETMEEVPSSKEPGGGSRTALTGESGASSQWGSGWLDLPAPRDFAKGERLRLRIGGSAEKILVRLLAKGMSPDSSRGLLGGVITVPADRIVEVTVDIDRMSVIQISVHGHNPWNKGLGQANGAATLDDVEVLNGGGR